MPGGRRAVTTAREDRSVQPQDPSTQYVGARHRHRRRSTPDEIELEHGHGHGHGPATPGDRRVRIAIGALLVPALLATLAGLIVLYPFDDGQSSAKDPSVRIAAHVTAAAGPEHRHPGVGRAWQGPVRRR